jgi:hypothetical protein
MVDPENLSPPGSEDELGAKAWGGARPNWRRVRLTLFTNSTPAPCWSEASAGPRVSRPPDPV